MLKTLLTVRLLISLFACFPWLFLGAIVVANSLRMVATGQFDSYMSEKPSPMLHLKSIDEDLKRHGIPIR
jgi:hypothetical protein